MVEKVFKEYKIKLTKQRKAIYNSLNNPITIKELIIKNKDIDQSTIYRIIELFLSKHIIDEELINNQIYYSLHNNDHIHYINCIKCNKKAVLEICPIKDIDGFTVTAHKIELSGICDECKKNSI